VSGVSGQTANAYDPERSAGGSSGGSATAAAASFAAFTLGTDACNSLSFPAALASVVTLRPTEGLTSRAGIAPTLPLQDVAGPMTRTVHDLAIVLDAIAGPDTADSTTAASRGRVPPSYATALRTSEGRGARLGVLRQVFAADTVEPAVERVVRRALADLRRGGATVVEVRLPDLETLQAASSAFNVRGEFGAALEAYLARRPELPYRTTADLAASGQLLPDHVGMFTRTGRRADGTTGTVGFGASSLNLETRAQVIAARRRFRDALVALMDRLALDALVYPSNLARADLRESPSSRYAAGTCETSAQTGLPQLTVPAGWIDGRFAVGLQFLGRPFDEVRLLRIGTRYERQTRHRRAPTTTP
jgi:Asp-tRNA(Asn)/Glu-tRNA(Gln) amidotransferase A subunit family amidase